MKVIVFILTVFIFGQSLAKCPLALPLKKIENVETIKKCSAKSCCKHKDEKGDQKSDEKKGCCKDGCHCLCCMKLIPTERTAFPNLVVHSFFKQKISGTSNLHSFDYNHKLKIPPQV